MHNSFEDSLVVMRKAIQQYVDDNQVRASNKASCFHLRSALRQGHDLELSQSKLKLAKNIVYTFDKLGTDYRNEMRYLGNQISTQGLRGDQGARLAYFETVKGFACLKDCIEKGLAQVKDLNGLFDGAGRLSQKLGECQRFFDEYWNEAKNAFWLNTELHGKVFAFDEDIKPYVFHRFDKELQLHQGQFPAILESLEQESFIHSRATSTYAPLPATAPPQDMEFVEIKLGNGKTVSIR